MTVKLLVAVSSPGTVPFAFRARDYASRIGAGLSGPPAAERSVSGAS
jgi:hypothetical protein